MTASNVVHLNSYLSDLKEQHKQRIKYLEDQIKKQKEEIHRLNALIKKYG